MSAWNKTPNLSMVSEPPPSRPNSDSITNSNNPTRFDATTRDYNTWAHFFYANGYITLDNTLSADQLVRLNNDLTKADSSVKPKKGQHTVHKCFFEHSPATVDLIESSVLYDFAAYLIADVPGGRGNTLAAHLIHNNAFTIPPGGRGQAPTWHTDDCLQNVIIPPGHTLPDWIRIPVVVATWMIWLSDVQSEANGPTYVVPGSHRWGQIVDQDKASALGLPCCGKAGTATLVNNQTWHRGSRNTSQTPRSTLQLTFARRIVGHKYGSIMNYFMPSSVYAGRSTETKARMGYLQGGAYS